MERTAVAAKIKDMLIENLRIPAELLEDDAELFGGGIGLDSVDSLEIIANSCIYVATVISSRS